MKIKKILMLALIFPALVSANFVAQTIRKVEIFGPAIGNASNNEVAVVNSTGLVYIAGQAFGGNLGVIDPNTNSLIKVIRSDANNPVTISFSRVNQTTNIVYFLQPTSLTSPTSSILPIDGRASSPTFNQALPLISFPNETIAAFAIDQTRSRLYATTRTTGSSPVQSQIQIIDINPASPTFHRSVATIALPGGQQAGHIAVNTVTNKIYVATSFASVGGVFVLNGATQAVTKITGTVQTGLIAVNETSNTIYAGLNSTFTGGTSAIQAIDGINDTYTKNIDLPGSVGGTLGEQIAVNPVTERVYAALSNGSLAVIDAKRTSPTFNTALANIPNVGNGEVAVDPGTNKIVVASNNFKTSIIDGATNIVVATTTGNFSSVDVAINPVTRRAYVGYAFFTTQAINLDDNSFINIGTTGEIGSGLVNPNNNAFYFPRNAAKSEIAFLDQTDNVGLVTGLPNDFGRYLFSAQNTTTNRLYFANSTGNLTATDRAPGFVSVVNGATNAVIANVEVGGQPFGDPAVNETTNKIYVLNAGSGTGFPSGISVINGATNTSSAVNTSAFPANTLFFQTIVANPVTNKIYFRLPSTSTVGVINGATDVAAPLPGFTGTFDILVNRALNRVYFLTSTGVRVLNGDTDAEIANIPLASPSQIVLNNTTGKIFARSFSNKTLTVIDAATNTVTNSVTLVNAPGSLTIDETRNRIYIANVNDFNDENTTVTFIDGNSLAVKRTLPIPLRAGRISVNPATQTVYVTTVNASQRTGIVVISDTNSTPFDFEGDGGSDLSVFRPSDRTWYLLNSRTGFAATQFGLATDKLVPADYDGDGRTDIAVYRNGDWYILQSSNSRLRAVNFGIAEDIPRPADFDGDGRADIAVFRPSSGTWFYQRSSDLQFRGIQFGQTGDVPMIADFDVDGKSDVAVFRPSNGVWYWVRSSDGQFQSAQFGATGDVPINADFNGDGRSDLAVFRPANGTWYVARTTGVPSQNFDSIQFGVSTDLPVAADYDGDGKTDFAVFRANTGVWYQLRSTGGFTAVQFGASGDKPAPNLFTP